MYQAGLVLEGGGMKGVYTAGVLDYFLKKGLEFSHCYGVSAGSCNMASYLSKQYERAYKVCVDYLKDKRYCSLYSLLTTGDLFGVKMCYDEIPNRLNPFDHKTFESYQGEAYAVVTNIETGKPEYLPLIDMHEDIIAIRASCSLPLVSRNVKIGDHYYLDGGMSDSLPIKKSIADGNRKNVVVLTKETGYVRRPSSQMKLMSVRYRKYPHLVQNMRDRHMVYNTDLAFIEEEEKKGNLFVVRPLKENNLGRIEKDEKKLREFYNEGFEDAKNSYEGLLQYLEK